MDDAIHFYENEYYMLSNFSAFSIRYKGRDWPTSEHAYQAMKFLKDTVQENIRKAPSPYHAKLIAKQYSESKRTDWQEIKLGVMEEILKVKLEQYPYIQKKLIESEEKMLVENSPIDSFWGSGPDNLGTNHLGKIWMSLRKSEMDSK